MPVDLNQTIAEASLDNLHDIIVPDAVGVFPLAPGWTMVLLLLLTLLFHFGYRYYKAYQKEQYRRDAKKEIETLNDKSRENMIVLLDLAKRVAIAAYGREVIAPLQGERWWDFVEVHSKATVNSELRASIKKLLYKENATFDDSVFDVLFLMVLQWIKTHKRTLDA